MSNKNITLSANEKIGLVSNLSTMLSAGIPILEAVDSLLDGAKGNQKKVLQMLYDDVSQGQHVYTSFEKFPNIFNPVTIQIIKAAEEAGTLEVSLKDIKEDIRKEAEFADKIRGAMIYPSFILCVFLGVMVLLLTFVVPRISTVFSRLKVDMPLPTRIMIAISNFILTYQIGTILIVILIVFVLIFLYKTQKKAVTHFIASLPVLTGLVRMIDLTKFSRSLFLLLNAGIPITTALELTENTVSRKDVAKAIARCREMVGAGKKMSDGFKEAKNIFPSIMIKITEAGERSGSLDKSMRDISEYLDYQVENSLKTATALIEPLMLVIVGICVGGMMMAIIAPIYSIIGQVAGR